MEKAIAKGRSQQQGVTKYGCDIWSVGGPIILGKYHYPASVPSHVEFRDGNGTGLGMVVAHEMRRI